MARVLTEKIIHPGQFTEEFAAGRYVRVSRRRVNDSSEEEITLVISEQPPGVEEDLSPFFTQAELEAAVEAYVLDPNWEVAPSIESTIREQAEAAIDAIRAELAAWPNDLGAGADLAATKARVNQMMAQSRRNTVRVLKLIQIALHQFDAAD